MISSDQGGFICLAGLYDKLIEIYYCVLNNGVGCYSLKRHLVSFLY